MPYYQTLDHDILCIDTEQHRPRMAACYLIADHGRHAFVECGTSLSVPGLLAVLDAHGVARDSVDFVMPTHVHLDHAGGAGALMRELPNARLVIHPRGARHMIDPSQLIAGATAVYGEATMRATYGEIVPIPEARVVIADVAQGRDFHLSLGQRELRFIDAPGHAAHHFAIWDARSRGWFSGDVFGLAYREFDHDGGCYLIPTTSPVQFDPAAWETTLQRMLEARPACMYLTHYGRVDFVDALATDLRHGLATYQRIARELAQAPDRHAQLCEAMLRHHLDELRERHNPIDVRRARELLEMDVDISAQGLGVWLDREARHRQGAA